SSLSNPPMQYHDPLTLSLVLPLHRPRDGRSTLPILPSLPQLGLLRCREPNPRRHHGTPPSPRKIRRCCADRLNPPPKSRHSASARVYEYTAWFPGTHADCFRATLPVFLLLFTGRAHFARTRVTKCLTPRNGIFQESIIHQHCVRSPG